MALDEEARQMITGEALYKLACLHLIGKEPEYADWGKMAPWIQNYYNSIAEGLNEQFFTPLLVQVQGYEHALQFKEENQHAPV